MRYFIQIYQQTEDGRMLDVDRYEVEVSDIRVLFERLCMDFNEEDWE